MSYQKNIFVSLLILVFLLAFSASCEDADYKGASSQADSPGSDVAPYDDWNADQYANDFNDQELGDGAIDGSDQDKIPTVDTEKVKQEILSNAELNSSDLVEACRNAGSSLKQGTTFLSFSGNEGQKDECEWKFKKADNTNAGIKTWKTGFELDSGRTMCSIKFRSEKSFAYDDAFAFTTNDKIIFWGNLFVNVLEKKEGIPIFDHALLQDNNADFRNTECVVGALSCDLPAANTNSDILVSFDESTGFRIVHDLVNNGSEFQLHVFGDDDDNDCTHNGLELSVEYSYIDAPSTSTPAENTQETATP